jgi:hypothetical protein
MPRPHFPARGGARLPQYGNSASSSDRQETCQGCKEKAAEIARLRNDINASKSVREEGRRRMIASPMLWAALGICGVGLLFAIFAIVRHG